MKRLIGLLLLIAGCAAPASMSHNITGYYDCREFGTLNLETAAAWDNGVSLYGFTDLHSTRDDADLEDFFSRYQLAYDLDWHGFRLETEYDDLPGVSGVLRGGVGWKHELEDGWLLLKGFPTDTSGGQKLAFVWRYDLTDDIWLDGFVDYVITDDHGDEWVAEPQINFAVADNVSVAIEARYNGFLDANDDFGVAIGVRYAF